MALARAPRRRVDGVLLLDKPRGLSSNAALQRAKRLLAAEKAGHTGTLDPLATGLLPLCFGEATKFAHALLDARKEYLATVAFGVATDTGDAEGEDAAHLRRGDIAGSARRRVAAIRRHDRASTAPLRRAQASGPQLLRIRARGHRDPARGARGPDRRDRAAGLGAAAREAARCLRQGHVHPRARRGHRGGGRELRASLGAATHRRGPFCARARRDARRARGDDDWRSATRSCCPRIRRSPGSSGSTSTRRRRSRSCRDAAGARLPARSGKYRCYGPAGRFVGLVESANGELRALRLARTDEAPPP